MPRKSLDLSVLAIVTIIGVVLALLNVNILGVRALFGVLLVLVLPGYALVAVLFPSPSLRTAERGLLTIVFSVILGIVGGLVLNLIPWGIETYSWTVLFGIITLGLAAVAYRRRPAQALSPQEGWLASFNGSPAVFFGLGVLGVAVALVIAHIGAIDAQTADFTQLWVLPADSAQATAVRLGIRSFEPKATQYKLQLLIGTTVVQEWPAITLNPGGTWDKTSSLPMEASATQPVAALLYRADSPQNVYRRVVWWPGSQQVGPGQLTPTLPREWPTFAPPGVPTPTPVSPTPSTTPSSGLAPGAPLAKVWRGDLISNIALYKRS